MNILGIETATMMIGVAIVDEQGVRAEFRHQVSRSRSERLMPMIDRVLKDSLCQPQDLNGLAVSIGPGSFTGLRIGVSTAKGLALALGLPATGVSTLEVLAAPVLACRPRFAVCPMLDAKRDEVYACLFRADQDGKTERLIKEGALAPQGIIDQVLGQSAPVLFLGTGALRFESDIKKQLGDQAIIVSRADPYPSPAVVATLGREKLIAEGGNASSLVPVYLSRLEIKTQSTIEGSKTREC